MFVKDRCLSKLIRETIASLGLDLSGLTVLTEAASGPYAVTPVIAALAHAERVIAATGESRYASVDGVLSQTRELASVFGLTDAIEIHTERTLDLFSRADIVTNLGFVRPIDREAVQAMKPTAVVPLMCEAWEFRPGDIDLDACRTRGILVLGTDEHHPTVDVFSYNGWLAMKMLFDAGIEIHKSKILIVSRDKFGETIDHGLRRAGVDVRLCPDLRGHGRTDLASTDAVLVCDYGREDYVVGPDGDVTAEELAAMAPGIRIVDFAGPVDVTGLQANGISVYPGDTLPPHRMARTLAWLGLRPVVELHAAGLKIGEVASRIRKSVANPVEAQAAIRQSCPFAQAI